MSTFNVGFSTTHCVSKLGLNAVFKDFSCKNVNNHTIWLKKTTNAYFKSKNLYSHKLGLTDD